MSTGITSAFAPWSKEEDRVVREHYVTIGARGIASRLPTRTIASIRHRANRLGVLSRRRWTPKDDRTLRDSWGIFKMSIRGLAKLLNRTPLTVYWRASVLGLDLGCPQGYEYLTHAAKRTGFSPGQLRDLMRKHGADLMQGLSRPTKIAPSRRYHVVDPYDVDRAIARWAKTECVNAAAKARGLCGQTLSEWLVASGLEKPKGKVRWRVPTAIIDRVVAKNRAVFRRKTAHAYAVRGEAA